jgi:hypothetical protein
VIGWIVALIWAFGAVQKRSLAYPQKTSPWQPTGKTQASQPHKTSSWQPADLNQAIQAGKAKAAQFWTEKGISGQIPRVILSACAALFLIVLLVTVFFEPSYQPTEETQVSQKTATPATSNASSSVPLIKRAESPSPESKTSKTARAEVTIPNPRDKWVTVDRLNRRTCPSTSCGVVGQLFYRSGVTIHETRGDWVRITKYYIDASCLWSDKAEYVDKGRNDCSSANGFREDGSFAEWVSAKYLSETRPLDPSAGRTGLAKIIGGSDDFHRYEAEFLKAAESLIQSGRCTIADFEEVAGWWKSTTTYKDRPVYFTYCGGLTIPNRIYLDVSTGQIFR